jgi:hypothetical protein
MGSGYHATAGLLESGYSGQPRGRKPGESVPGPALTVRGSNTMLGSSGTRSPRRYARVVSRCSPQSQPGPR